MQVDLIGTTFIVDKEDGMFLLYHDIFPLGGCGKTFTEAYHDLVQTVIELRYGFSGKMDEYSLDGMRFAEFLRELDV
jgi:hypothetical protein